MKKLFIFYFSLSVLIVQSQNYTITPSVINSAGGSASVTVGTNNYEVYYNIGETCITTISTGSTTITQGFLQPEFVISDLLSLKTYTNGESCLEKNDGIIRITTTETSPIIKQVKYAWSPNSVCPDSTCKTLDNLKPGMYQLKVIISYTASTKVDTVGRNTFTITASQEACQIAVYNGISPNNDGVNDVFYINNIENFPDNEVFIYNRWGQQLAAIKNYDNLTRVWRGNKENSTEIVSSGTYFYIIQLNNGTKPIKGFIELTSFN